MPPTPEQVKVKVNRAIDSLDTRCGLRLGSYRNTKSEGLDDPEERLSRTCVQHLTRISYRERIDLRRIVDSLGEYAKSMKTNWVWKPEQEAGTLPGLPETRSARFKDTLSKPFNPGPAQRQKLLEHLHSLLQDECRLLEESDVYGAPSFKSIHSTPSKERGGATQATGQSKSGISEETSRKRATLSDGFKQSESPPKRRSIVKKQSSIEKFFKNPTKPDSLRSEQSKLANEARKLSDDPSILGNLQSSLLWSAAKPDISFADLPGVTTSAAPAISFNSTSSAEVPRVWTPQRSVSSNATSILEDDVSHEPYEDPYCPSLSAAEALDRSFEDYSDLVSSDVRMKQNSYVATPTSPSTLGAKIPLGPQFPTNMPFRCRYELLRISQFSHLPVSDLVSSTSGCREDYTKMWKAISVLASNRSAVLPDKCSLEAWNSATGNFQTSKGDLSVILSATLQWAAKRQDDLFDIQLKPLKTTESCRFHREYGSDRFLTVSLPSLTMSLPVHLQRGHPSLRSRVVSWLVKSEHFIADRTWKAYYVEPIKRAKWKKRNRPTYTDSTETAESRRISTEKQLYKVHLFATEDCDFTASSRGISAGNIPRLSRNAIPIADFLNWHIPIKENMTSTTDCKAFQRFALGLSQTIPTVVLQKAEFAHLKDLRNSSHGKVMNDGCARMSETLAIKIASVLGLTDIPSVFQARIAGAKGLWMVDHDDIMKAKYPEQMAQRNFCVEVNDSQLKIQPHPKDDSRDNKAQRTFEVLDYSVPTRIASLNMQLLAILNDRKVPRTTMERMLLAGSASFHKGLSDVTNDRLRLREWIGANKLSRRGTNDIQYRGALPDESDEQVALLLESGFTPQDCPILHDRLSKILERDLDRYVEKLHIRVPLSTYLYCIPDPYGVLAPDEVHVEFSEKWSDIDSGFSRNFLGGHDVLVGRLPALLPSDVQRRKATWKIELRHFRDVIVCSTMGDDPLAGLLSGGDYDGDTLWLCWHPDIVKPFENADVPKDLPSEEKCGLVKKSIPLSQIFKLNDNSISASEAESFFVRCFDFNLNPSFLGLCTIEHEKVIYDLDSLSCEKAVSLAALASFLVDSSKQGLLLSEEMWHKKRSESSSTARSPPAYKDKTHDRQPKETNIIDYLKFWVAKPEKNKALSAFHNSVPRTISQENHRILSAPWLEAQRRGSKELIIVLEALKVDIREVEVKWSRRVTKDSDRDEKSAEGSFSQTVVALYDDLRCIKPRAEKHEFSSRWAAEQEERFSHWNILRASCLWNKSRGGKISWYLAGDELCHLKVKTMEGCSRTVSHDIYKALKIDKRVVKRITELQEEEDDDDDDDDEDNGDL